MIRGAGMSGGGGGGGGGGRRGPDSGQLHLPPGFRFYPSDEELVVHYLCKKAASQPFAVPIIAEIDLYKFDPWDLPAKALFGEKEWYFFSPRDRKYPNGSRPNRAAGSGYWKATGTDKPIGAHHVNGGGQKVGVKKALVFYNGRPPKGEKTNWIMHEYRLADSAAKAAKRKGSLRLDDWVLCRIYEKLSSATKLAMQKEEVTSEEMNEFDEVLEGVPHLEEDSKLAIGRTTGPMLGASTNYNNTYVVNHTNYSPNLNYNSFYQPYVQEMGSQAQIGPSTSHEQVTKPFIRPAPMNQEVIHRPYNTTSNTYNFHTSSGRPAGLSLAIPNLTPEHSPVNSSVDEESGLPVDQTGNHAGLPGHLGGYVNAVGASSDPPFNFDALPSPFGRLESLHQFPF